MEVRIVTAIAGENMATKMSTRKRLQEQLKKLPEDKIPEVLEFVHKLLTQSFHRIEERGDSTKDPLMTFIGGASHGALAQDIDRELYGTSL